MDLPYREIYRIRTYEADIYNRVKISSVFNYMQEAASNHANGLGFGFDDMARENLFWVLSRARIVMSHYPVTGEELVVETWPKGTDKVFALRDFRFYNGAMNLVGYATTAWLMVSKDSVRPVRPDPLLHKIPPHNIEPAIAELPGKIMEPGELELRGTVPVTYSDIDVNRHVNNVKYVEFAVDCFSERLFQHEAISSFQINFLKESKYGDHITLFTATGDENGNRSYIEGRVNQDIKIFQASVFWE